MAGQDRKETEHRLNQARRMAAALVTVTERLDELIDELEGKLRTEKVSEGDCDLIRNIVTPSVWGFRGGRLSRLCSDLLAGVRPSEATSVD